jgi:hypothetical protein
VNRSSAVVAPVTVEDSKNTEAPESLREDDLLATGNGHRRRESIRSAPFAVHATTEPQKAVYVAQRSFSVRDSGSPMTSKS